MGFEFAETIMELEDIFDVDFPDSPELETVGELSDIIHRLVEDGLSEGCQSSRVFFQLRGKLTQQFNVPKRTIHTDTELEDIIPMENRRDHWRDIATSLKIKLPNLERPGWLSTIIGVICVFAFLIPYFWADKWFVKSSPGFYTGSICMICVFALLLLITDHKAVCFPSNITTIRELVSRLLITNYASIDGHGQKYNASDIWMVVQGVVAEKLDLPLEKVTRDATLVKDLGMG